MPERCSVNLLTGIARYALRSPSRVVNHNMPVPAAPSKLVTVGIPVPIWLAVLSDRATSVSVPESKLVYGSF